MSFSPFFINSNLVTKGSSLGDYDTFMDAVAGNTGNSYITWALLKELGVKELKDDFHIQNIYNFDFSNTEKVSTFVNQNCTHVFLILQDQIRINESYGYTLPYDGMKNLLNKIKLPVIVAGLGANCFTGFDSEFYKQLNPPLVSFLHYLSERCNELGLRGNFTAEVLNQLGIKNVIPVGCPSFYETGRNRIITKKSDLSPSRILFTSNFYNYLNDTNFQVCQDHQEREIIKLISFNELGNSYKDEHLMSKYSRKCYKIFSSITDWKNFASNFDFSIGYRVHGSILALNSGCLPVCCNEDSRAREMCDLMRIPWMQAPAPETNLVELYKTIDVSDLNSTYPKLYDNFSSFLQRNCGVNISENSSKEKNPVSCSLKLYKDYDEIISASSLKLQFDFKRECEIKSQEFKNENNAFQDQLLKFSATMDNQSQIIAEQNSAIEKLSNILSEQSNIVSDLKNCINQKIQEADFMIQRK